MGSQSGHTRPRSLAVELMPLEYGGAWMGGTPPAPGPGLSKMQIQLGIFPPCTVAPWTRWSISQSLPHQSRTSQAELRKAGHSHSSVWPLGLKQC